MIFLIYIKKKTFHIHKFFLYFKFLSKVSVNLKKNKALVKTSMHVPKIPVQSLIYLAFLILITCVPIALCALTIWLCFYCRKKNKRIASRDGYEK